MIRSYRLKNKLTQEELAKKVGIDPRSLQRYESGERKPSIKIFKKII